LVSITSGPAGCVLANRLSENKIWSILLIEAGTVETVFQSVPLNAPHQVASRYNWGYIAEYQNYSCHGMIDGRCGYPRGKALGGSSVINGMLYTRGSKGDFDHWAKLGIDGWNYESHVLPAFKKSESADLKFFSKPEYHGKNGFLSIVSNPYSSPMLNVFVDGMKSLGYDEFDFNSDDSIGVGRMQSTTKNGKRHSAFESFIRPVLKRKNLQIMLNTRVTKILINPITKVAFGVEIYRNGRKSEFFAHREIILSAGTFHSPQILVHSGIGSSEDLKTLKIPKIVDLPVGKEMYDHLVFGGLIVTTDTPNEYANPFQFDVLRKLAEDWLHGRGLLTTPNGVEALGFIRLSELTPVESQPDIEIIMLGTNPVIDQGYGMKYGERVGNLLYDQWLKYFETYQNYTMTLGIVLLHPKSIGYLEIRSSNPFSRPNLYSNFLKEPEDVETILSAVRFTQKLIQTPPFQKINAKIYDKPMAMCESFEFDSDDYWRCAIRTFCLSLHHQVGTCKMGGKNDKTAVVDSRLKVIGVKNLRVIDTSVIPSATSAHTNALSFMIGERGADFIKMDHNEGLENDV